MIKDRDFLVLSDDWNGVPSSPKHLFRQIAAHNRVFWFNIINRRPQLKWNDIRRVASTLGEWSGLTKSGRKRVQSSEPNCGCSGCCYDATPLLIPWFKPGFRQLNCFSLLQHFRKVARRYRIRNPIVVTQWPSSADFVAAVPASLKVYYCVDEWLHYPGFSRSDTAAMEQKLIGCVDAFVATSRDLEKKGRRCPAGLYLPHGVDFDHFRHATESTEPIPALTDLPRPVVGFFGCLDEWVDLNAICVMAKRFSYLSFVLIGRRNVSLDRLLDCRNVHYLGAVPYAELPRYASHFDIGLIPFVRNELTTAVNPLKVLEYYALGLPVLATRLPELEAIGGPIRLATTPDEFCEGLQQFIDGKTPDVTVGIELARRSTWLHRAETLCDFLEACLEGAPHYNHGSGHAKCLASCT